MKALLFTLDFPPTGGGISRYNEGLARHWPGGELVVLAPDVPGAAEADATMPCRVVRRRFFTRLPTPHPVAGLPRAYAAAQAVVRAERPDLLLCGQPLTTGLVGLALRQGRPLVTFAHGEELRRHRASPARGALLRRVLARAARVVVVSEYGREEATWWGVDPARIVNVTGILPACFEPARDALPADLEGRIAARAMLLTVGRLEPRKAQDVVIRALARLPEPRPVLVVVGEGATRGALEALAVEHGVADRVIFAGRVTEPVLRALYARARLFVLAPRPGEAGEEEGLGLVFIEAAAAGTPSVAARVGGIGDAVVDGETGLLVAPDSVDQLAEAIRALLADPERVARLGAAARERARARYDWRVNAARLRDELASLVTA